MSGQAAAVIATDGGVAPGPVPLLRVGRSLIRFAGPIVSVALLVAVAFQFRHLGIAKLRPMIPTAIGFWLVFSVYYLVAPATEWIIFRRLWKMPPGGFLVLIRKLICNEILMGYLGEAYFYAWARRNTRLTSTPFGAIKDVTLLSGLVGNLVTLVMVAVAAPLLGSLHGGLNGAPVTGSAIIILAMSASVALLHKRLLTLPRSALLFIGGLHLARIAMTTIVAGILWHMLLPHLSISWLVLLGTLRLLVSRLPLLPNKDVVFAGMASLLVGNDASIASALALMAALILATHLALAAILGATELANRRWAQ